MNAAALTPLLLILTGCAWVSFGLLTWASFRGKRIAVLTERTFIAFVLAMLGSIAFVLRYNSDHGFALFEQPTAALIFAVTMLVVLSIPTAWLLLYILGRLGSSS